MADGAGELTIPNVRAVGTPITYYAQCIYADASLPSGFGFTNALEVKSQ